MEECEIIHRSEGKNYRTSRKVENQNRSGTNSVAMNSIFRALQQPFSFFAIIGLKNQISGQECSTALGWLSCLKLRFQDSGSSTKTVSHTGEGIPQRVLSRKRKRASGWTKTKQNKTEDSIHSTFDQAASSTEMPFLTARPTQPFESSSEIIASKQSSLTNAHTLTSCWVKNLSLLSSFLLLPLKHWSIIYLSVWLPWEKKKKKLFSLLDRKSVV